jgi:pimeloyl-ACP methyl ester carboxylesterase
VGLDNLIQVEAGDLEHVLGFVSTLPTPHNITLALVGHSQGAVVALLYASSRSPRVPRLLVNVSGRYSSAGTENRLPLSLLENIASAGRGVWLRYRAGSSWEKRDYVITKAALEAHRSRVLDCVRRLPWINVLTVHGRRDGTVLVENALKLDERIEESEATNDLILMAGVAHNWDGEGEGELLGGHVDLWLEGRISRGSLRKEDGVLEDHLASKPVRDTRS